MIGLTDYQQKAWELIKLYTKTDPITGLQVSRRINLKERDTGKEGADMRSIIHALRVKGYPVCANGKGYYAAKNVSELDEYAESLQGRITKEQEALTGLRQAKDYFKVGNPCAICGYVPCRKIYKACLATQERDVKPATQTMF